MPSRKQPTRQQPRRQVKNRNDNFTTTDNDNVLHQDPNHFTDEDNELLMNRVNAQLEKTDSLRCNERIKLLDWKIIKCGKKSQAACKAQIIKLLKPISRSRTLEEIIRIIYDTVSENNTEWEHQPKNKPLRKLKKETIRDEPMENGQNPKNEVILGSTPEIDFNPSTSKAGVNVKTERNDSTDNPDEPMENVQPSKKLKSTTQNKPQKIQTFRMPMYSIWKVEEDNTKIVI